MRNRKAGKVCDRLWYLGREESGIYLLEGEDSSLILSGGMSYLAPVVVEQLKDFGINEQKINNLIILHAHFDHVGLVPFFKRRYQQLEVFALARAWEILGSNKAVETINSFSHLVAERMGFSQWLDDFDLDWRDDVTGFTVSEGSRIELGGLGIRVLETPGHSSCSLSAYCPEIKALFPSDAGGVPFGEAIIPAGNSNYTQYQKSLEKLSDLPVDFLCADHYGYVTGDEAKNYIQKSIEAAKQHRADIEAIYHLRRSIDETVNDILDKVYKNYPGYFLPREIYSGVYRQTVRHIAGELDKKDSY